MNNSSLQQELRARFNPDGSLLRRHQLRMLEMLTNIDGVCVKHDIPYWLGSGTLLVRFATEDSFRGTTTWTSNCCAGIT